MCEAWYVCVPCNSWLPGLARAGRGLVPLGSWLSAGHGRCCGEHQRDTLFGTLQAMGGVVVSTSVMPCLAHCRPWEVLW